MTVYPEPNCSQVAVLPDGTSQVHWLGRLGHVTGLKYSFTYPGGPDKMTCQLEVPASYRSQALSLGADVRIYRGGHKIWDGRLDEPAPGPSGWTVTAVGAGNLAADYLATWTTWPSGQPDQVVDNAISRGLPWVNTAGIGSPAGIWLGQQQDSGSRSVKDVLDLACSRGGLGWYVNAQPAGYIGNDITVAALPATVTRLLVCTTPVPRTMGGDVRAIYVRYQSSTSDADPVTYALTSVTNTGHKGQEAYLDLSSAGQLTQAAAQAVATKILQSYQRASFAGPFTVTPGYLLTTGGVPVDPGCEQAGGVVRLILTDFAHGGEISPLTPSQFITGGYEWDDQERTGTITPYQTLDQSLSGVMSAEVQALTPITTA